MPEEKLAQGDRQRERLTTCEPARCMHDRVCRSSLRKGKYCNCRDISCPEYDARPHTPAAVKIVEPCPCQDCPHEVDRENNPCPMPRNCDQFKCPICVLHCSTPEQAARAAALAALDAYSEWDNSRWTTQRVKEYKESLRQQQEPGQKKDGEQG